MKLLVVEDDRDAAAFIVKGLRENGHAVDLAEDGRQGLFLATSERFDAIILDRMLPGIDGLTILSALRASASAGVRPKAREPNSMLRSPVSWGMSAAFTPSSAGVAEVKT